MTSAGWDSAGGDLLEGIAPPPSSTVRSGVPKDSQLAHKAWAAWAAETKRPDAKNVPSKFVHAYLSQLRAHRANETLMQIVRGAARLPVKANNADDTRRVIGALTSPNIGRTALALAESDAEPVPYRGGDLTDPLSSIDDLTEACSVPPSHWTERDQDAAGIVMEKLTPDEVRVAGLRAASAVGLGGVLPTDLLRAHHSKAGRNQARRGGGDGVPVRAAARETYVAGVAERSQIKGVEFPLDDLANEMYLQGKPPAEIVRVHNLAPEGYWDAVYELAIEGDSNAAAYDRLVADFGGWHPGQRSTD